MYHDRDAFVGEPVSVDEALGSRFSRRKLMQLLAAGGGIAATAAAARVAVGGTATATGTSGASGLITVVQGSATGASGAVVPKTIAVAQAQATDAATRAERRARRLARQLKNAPPLSVTPTALTGSVITVDLSMFDPTKPFPGWNGKAPSQSTDWFFPRDRDLLIIGHSSQVWTGGGFIRGGRNVHWIGGAYTKGPYMRNFMGDGCVEGVLVRCPYVEAGRESGDGVVLLPDPLTLGQSKLHILNCRIENIDGFLDRAHGDCVQLAPTCGPTGWSSCPRELTIERFTGTTGYQGLFLPNQHFDALGYQISVQKVTLRDVNMRKTRLTMRKSSGACSNNVGLLYMLDMFSGNRGDRPYPKVFRNVFLEPFAGEGLDRCIYPAAWNSGGINPCTKTKLAPTISSNGHSAIYPPEMLLDGMIEMGPPPGGDFAKAAGPDFLGALNVPGIGYVSPGYTA